MPVYFLDTSVLVKLYVDEPGSVGMAGLAAAATARLAVSSLGALEFRVALRARVRRSEITPGLADAMLTHFVGHAARTFLHQPLTGSVFAAAEALVDRYPLRAPDALQLASCVALHQSQPGQELYFVGSDRALLAAAAAEHIPHWDPTAGAPPPG